MTDYPAAIPMFAIQQLRCPKCRARMKLARTSPGPTGFELKRFDCSECDHVEQIVSIGFHWIIRRYDDLFDVIAFGAVEPLEFKSCRPRRGTRKLHARAAFWAAELLNCEHWDCGWVICHCIPPCFRRERNTLSHR